MKYNYNNKPKILKDKKLEIKKPRRRNAKKFGISLDCHAISNDLVPPTKPFFDKTTSIFTNTSPVLIYTVNVSSFR